MLTRRAALFSAAAVLLLATPASADDLNLPRQHVDLVAPPFVHAHEQATKEGPRIMEFKLVIEEKKVVIDDQGTTFHALTFNGSMPGPLMVVHEGDYVEVTLVNPAIEAAILGATAHFKVEGKWNDDLMMQVKAPAKITAASTN